MSLNLALLENAKNVKGGVQYACPACREVGGDTDGDNLLIYASGAFNCILARKDTAHNRRIYALAGLHDGKDAAPVSLEKQEQQKRRVAEEESKIRRGHEAVADELSGLCGVLPVADDTHPYLAAKWLGSHGLLLEVADGDVGPALVVTLEDVDGRIWSVQRIWKNPDGGFSKWYAPGGRTQGRFHPFGTWRNSPDIIIAEGWATAASVFEATGIPTLAAMDCGNLMATAENVKRVCPDARLVFAADNDIWDKKTGGRRKDNPGVKAATNASKAFKGSVVVVPRFKNTSSCPSDFNDLLRLEGDEEVNRQITTAMTIAMNTTDTAVLPGNEDKPVNTSLATSENEVVLPSAAGSVTISAAAAALFPRLAATQSIFWRGGVLVELAETDGLLSLAIVKEPAFRSRAEKVCRLMTWRLHKSSPVKAQATMSSDMASALMNTIEARLLPPIASILSCPVLIEVEGKPVVLNKGYHHAGGGILITKHVNLGNWKAMSVGEATGVLWSLLDEFDFQSDGDRTRAFAALLTPALRLGGHITGPIPMDVAEADQSQAGKGFRQSLVTTLYSEKAYIVTTRNGGVGGSDESLSSALLAGRPFICLDNIRGRLDSQTLESFLTCPGMFSARVPGRGEVQINPKPFLLQASSNGMETTKDLSNRASIVRIRKRPGFQYRDTLGALSSDQGLYLGAVFRLIAEWIEAGKPRTKETRHDFREWTQILDWICQKLVGTGPLMDGHQAAQERTCNPALNWLRSVALAVEFDSLLGQGFIAGQIVEICRDHEIEIPGGAGRDENGERRAVGMAMKKLFVKGDKVEVDDFRVSRGTKAYRKPSGDLSETSEYFIERPKTTTPPP